MRRRRAAGHARAAPVPDPRRRQRRGPDRLRPGRHGHALHPAAGRAGRCAGSLRRRRRRPPSPAGPTPGGAGRPRREVKYLGEPGFLPVRVGPGDGALLRPADPARPEAPHQVAVDASGSSQFLSALLLAGCLLPGGLAITPTGPVPSLPHVAMTVEFLRGRGVTVDEPDADTPVGARTWTVHPGAPQGGTLVIEPDLSNAGPFLAAALVAGGRIGVRHWPAHTTQAGDAWRWLLPCLGGAVEETREADGSLTLTAVGTGKLHGIDADLSAVGELTPTVAALAALASAQGHASRLRGIGHLRGHETDRLAALEAEINRVGGRAHQTDDGLEIAALPAGARLRPARLRAYADHRMATFAAVVGLGVKGVEVDDIACTTKTLPDFPALWARMLGLPSSASPTSGDRHLSPTETGTSDIPKPVAMPDAAEEAR
ncbi:3-phosphoshikimate 1-carboxyvinyltransferase [Actinomyces ruminis]|uniref:3-phosphoshikimate 1-carboxyvinyltransferase n=1 Tax=Actinomyces ruminis TaxID=1937003 RepID=A0ABX4MER4_9ACTO|nr:3-phosphoshikimate 1-carboxyvinyltransferase [Actinomyces ruminis]